MASRLILMAHAETDAMRQGRFGADDALSVRGRDAATALAASLPAADATFVSPARAAVETAAALGLSAMVDGDLRDLDAGVWAGRPVRDLAAEDPQALAAWRLDPDFAAHGGESIAALLARVGAWIATRQTQGGTTLCVTHPMVCCAAVIAVLGAPCSAFWTIDVAPLGRVILSSDGRRWALRELLEE